MLLYELVKASNERRRTSWESEDDAMRWFRKHIPWKVFHPDVLHIISVCIPSYFIAHHRCHSKLKLILFLLFQETYFRPDPEHPGRITTKTTVEQETACFLDDGTHLGALPYLRTILHILPTHIISGSNQDIWSVLNLCR